MKSGKKSGDVKSTATSLSQASYRLTPEAGNIMRSKCFRTFFGTDRRMNESQMTFYHEAFSKISRSFVLSAPTTGHDLSHGIFSFTPKNVF